MEKCQPAGSSSQKPGLERIDGQNVEERSPDPRRLAARAGLRLKRDCLADYSHGDHKSNGQALMWKTSTSKERGEGRDL